MVKKISVFGLSALLMVAFVSSSVLAGAGCGMHKTTKAGTAQAATASAKMHGMSPEECAKLCGMTPEECAKLCAGKENCGFTQMSIKGMTSGGCESQISKTLASIDGVHKVIKVDHKEGIALLCCDPTKVEGKTLTTAVINKGYQAEIIPAVAMTTDAPAKTETASGKIGCSPTCAKTCATLQKTSGCPSGKTKVKKSDEG
ncbi:MAG: cation transporter [candidate division Zixibacteria bacterium]|nr:cation transporter [candidate division Zixibacteria bacterium]